MLTLRPYQLELIDRARTRLKAGVRRLLVQAPTGAGKTCLVAHMLSSAAARGRRSWFIVHRKELIDQSVSTFVSATDLHVGIVAAGYPMDTRAPVQVCGVGSLAKRLAKLEPPDMVVWDESHHIAAKSWSAIAAALPNAVHIGLTATPVRLDGKGLRSYFDDLVCGPTTADLIAQGYLSPYRLFAPAPFDVSALHKIGGDYNRAEVADQMGRSRVVGDAVSTYRQHCAGGRALVFAWSLDASRSIAEAFTSAGIPAAHVDGATAREERTEIIAKFRDGDIRVLCNCELFGEGFDVPAVDAVFLLRPTASLGLYLQQCGRGLRAMDGKDRVDIFDHCGNYERHGLPDEARQWSLDGVVKSAVDRPTPLKRCPSCFAVSLARAKACPYCGAAYPVKARKVLEVAGALEEVTALRANVRELQRECRTLADWQALARRLEYKAGWAWIQWQRSVRHRRTA